MAVGRDLRSAMADLTGFRPATAQSGVTRNVAGAITATPTEPRLQRCVERLRVDDR